MLCRTYCVTFSVLNAVCNTTDKSGNPFQDLFGEKFVQDVVEPLGKSGGSQNRERLIQIVPGL